MSAASPPHLKVALDKPLIPSDPLFYATRKPAAPGSPIGWLQPLSALLVSEAFMKAAAATIITSLVLLLVLRGSSSGSLADSLRRMAIIVREKVAAAVEAVVGSGVSSPKGTPMYFDAKANEGWGVCTLVAKRRLGKTAFAQYDFDLPDPDTYIDLELGQQISLCCLDNDSNVVKGDFFPYQPERRSQPGRFSILVPNPPNPDDTRLLVGSETARFVNTLKKDMKVGDEIAVKPGSRKLDYKGQFLPVTDMVYVAHGAGIVPVLEQVRTVLPAGSSTVKSVSVAWINDETRDFDVNADLLEREYYRYRKKMAVSCIVEDLAGSAMRDSVEINAAVPSFQPGTMAVVAGPEAFADKTVDYLRERGYPRDTICVL
jgi:NAD(P)H-flavin reductase